MRINYNFNKHIKQQDSFNQCGPDALKFHVIDRVLNFRSLSFRKLINDFVFDVVAPFRR